MSLPLKFKKRLFNRYGIPFSPHGVPPSVAHFLKPGKPITYLDIGASAGDVTAAVRDHYGVSRALLVEPQPARCAQLRARFPSPDFEVCECALSDRDEVCEMDILSYDYSSSILPIRQDMPNLAAAIDLRVKEKISCRVTTLDALLRQVGWSAPVDLLKIDVQGAELMALRGAKGCLDGVRFLLTEVSFKPLYQGSCVFNELFDFLTLQNFRLLSLNEGFRGADQELLQGDALFEQRTFRSKHRDPHPNS